MATTRTDAVRELQALRVDLARGEEHRSAVMVPRLGELAAEYVEHIESRVGNRDPKRRYSERTVELYESLLRVHVLPALGGHRVDEITVSDVRRLVDGLERHAYAGSTVRLSVRVLRNVLAFGVKRGVLERNVCRDLERDDLPSGKRQKEPRYLDEQEIAALLERMTDTWRVAAALCAYAGLRQSEALAVRWRDVDLRSTPPTLDVNAQLSKHGERVPLKTDASCATVGMLPALVAELRAHRSRQAERGLEHVRADALVCETGTGRAQDRHNFARAIRAAGNAAGLNGEGRKPVAAHDLRHSFCAAALAAGLSVADVAALARHAGPQVTLAVYGGVVATRRETLVARLADAGFGA